MRSVAKRVVLFLLLNVAIIFTISILLSIFNIRPYLTQRGVDYGALLTFCLIWGFVGAFISLAMSRLMAKWMMGVEVIDPDTTNPQEQMLLTLVRKLIKRAGLPKMPEVGIYESPEVNAFATGPSRSRALVAVSSGLLSRMNITQIEGVVGHEISHISNGDMVTMTLLQGVVNAFVMFFARVCALVLTRVGRQRESSSSPLVYIGLVFLFQILFMILGAIIIAAFSRFREYRADAGGARLAGREAMIEALVGLKSLEKIEDPRAQQTSFQAFKISNRHAFLHLFASHPKIEERIARLKAEK